MRPPYSVLGSIMLESVLAASMRPWEEALGDYLAVQAAAGAQERACG